MTAGDLFRRIVAALDAAGIAHMLTGSFASSYHGSPRATQDIDLVIEADAERLRAFARSLPPAEYYVDEDAAVESLSDESQFNVVDLATGWKIDLIIRKSRPFSVEEFGRRQHTTFDGATIAIATLEDLIIAKLEWASLGASSRQLEDVAALIRVRGDAIDREYVGRWVGLLGLERLWVAAVAHAESNG